jgi:hypothetical protein
MTEPRNGAEWLLDGCFCVVLNANDTFAYACADSLTIEGDDMPWAVALAEKYQRAGVLAAMTVKRGAPYTPPIPPVCAMYPLYEQALAEAIETAAAHEILPEGHELSTRWGPLS